MGKESNVRQDDTSSVEQIKNLIFGAEIRVFNEQFTALEKQLNDHKRLFDKKIQLLSEEIAGNLANLDGIIQTKLDANQKQLQKEIEKLNDDKVDREKLKEVLLKIIEGV